jgi:superfamily II DNA/RNA helicase
MNQPMTVHAGHDENTGPSPQTRQLAYRTHSLNKAEVVARILQASGRGLTMVFTRTKRAADRLSEELDFRGFAVAAVHGDLGQGARERALRAFRTGKIDILVATDVAARGLDVTGVTHVINYDCPEDADTYVHRIGRTGRAGATGVAVTFVDWEDLPRWLLIDKTLQLDMPEPPETYHTSAWLFTDLEIPDDVGATLPTDDRTRVGLSAEVLEDVEGKAGKGRRRTRSSSRSAGRKAPTTDGSAVTSDAVARQRRRRKIVEGESAAAATTDEAARPTDEAAAPARRPRRRRRRSGSAQAGADTVTE